MTKETEKAFKILYCAYKQRRKDGCSKSTAMEFDCTSIGAINAFQKWLPDDIDYALHELNAASFVRQDIIGNVTLTETGIEYMESKPKEFFEGLSGFFDLIGLFV